LIIRFLLKNNRDEVLVKKERRFGLLAVAKDRRTVLFMAITTATLITQWIWSDSWDWKIRADLATLLHGGLFGLACFLAVTVSTITNNHEHDPIWRFKWMNCLQDYWLTLFYGYPIFAWIPTHNRNHHVLNNKKGDASITYRFSEKNNLLTLLSYPAISGFYQQRVSSRFISGLWKGKNRRGAIYFVSQAAVLILFNLFAFVINWKKALLFVFIPQQISLNMVLIFNYIQHVHADEESRWDHSRNFVSPVLNFFLFNNGYHTIHHEKPLLHWSCLKECHEKIVVPKINPVLNESGFWSFMIRTYILSLFFPRFQSNSMRLERLARVNKRVEKSDRGSLAQLLFRV
jgi:fatty acid desaturase